MFRDDYIKVKKMSKYYGWQDTHWSSWMVQMMQYMEPRKYMPGEIIYHDMEEVDEILFVT